MSRHYLLYAEQNYAYAMLRPLQQAIRARGDEAAWFLAGQQINPDYLKLDEVRLPSVRTVCDWQPDAVLVPGNTVPSFIPGLKVAIFHGFNVAKATRSDDRGHFNIRGCFDLYCTQGPNTTAGFVERAGKHGYFEVVETGWPALDPLFSAPPAGEEANPRPTILFCSTFTPALSAAPLLVDEIRRLRDSGRWRWLVQFHPKMDPAVVAAYQALQDDNLTFVETDNVIPLLQQADVMLCDTSSVMTMFLLQHRPVVTFRNQTVGNRQHLLDVSEVGALEAALEHALSRPPALMQAIDGFIAQTHPYTDGHASTRVLDAIEARLQRGPGALKRKPLNLLRSLKERRKLGYWWPGSGKRAKAR